MSTITTRKYAGTLTRIDLISRTLCVDGAEGVVQLAVPPQAPILLQGELVRLRMLTPGDPVTIEVTDGPGGPAAASVTVPG